MNALHLVSSKDFEIAFKMFDQDGNGVIDRYEFEQVGFAWIEMAGKMYLNKFLKLDYANHAIANTFRSTRSHHASIYFSAFSALFRPRWTVCLSKSIPFICVEILYRTAHFKSFKKNCTMPCSALRYPFLLFYPIPIYIHPYLTKYTLRNLMSTKVVNYPPRNSHLFSSAMQIRYLSTSL